MKKRSEVDEAFRALIRESGDLLAQGQARTPFAIFRKPPKRLELEFSGAERVAAPASPFALNLQEAYAPLYEELNRFEPHAVLFTAAEPGQGVSFTAHNLACLWGAAGDRTLLLELYNGASSLAYDLPRDAAKGAGNPQNLEQCFRFCPENRIYLLSMHAPEAEALPGEAWDRLKASFRRIVVDCSPFWHNALAPKMAPLTDGVVFIAGRPLAKPVVDRLERDLSASDSRFIGVIMNAVAAQERLPEPVG